MKLITTLIMSIMATSAFAFHSVTEILPSGKILICRDAGQIKKGDTVEEYRRTNPRSGSDLSTTKTKEFKLPNVGEKITLTHKDFHTAGKASTHHMEEIGTAIISGDSLEGEERVSYTLDNSRHSRRIETKSKITKEEAQKIQSDCLVAIMVNGKKLTENAAVSW